MARPQDAPSSYSHRLPGAEAEAGAGTETGTGTETGAGTDAEAEADAEADAGFVPPCPPAPYPHSLLAKARNSASVP